MMKVYHESYAVPNVSHWFLGDRYHYCLHFAEEDTSQKLRICNAGVIMRLRNPHGHIHTPNMKNMTFLWLKQRRQPVGTHHGKSLRLLGPVLPSQLRGKVGAS